MNNIIDAKVDSWNKLKEALSLELQNSSATPSTSGGGGGTYDSMEARVKKLEDSLTEIKLTLGRIDERSAAMSTHLATKADVLEAERRISEKVSAVETRVGVTEGELRRTLGVWQFLGIMVAAVALIVKWPAISAALGI